ncbi:uncharacterized protein [Euwallacea similis]|uniref:uncharacterized protein n=1 Tax=Euwallacea similis TaxID=1736056 RepID=UPI00344C8814
MDNLIIRLKQRPLRKKKTIEGIHKNVVVKYLDEPLKEVHIVVVKDLKVLHIDYYDGDERKYIQFKNIQNYRRYNKTVELILKNNSGAVVFHFKDEEEQDRLRVDINALSSSSESEI